MTASISRWLMKLARRLTSGLHLSREPIDSVSKANWLLVTLDLFAFLPNEGKLPTNWNYLRTSPEFMTSSTFLNSGVASRILSVEWTTKRLISKIISPIENTPFVFLIKPSVPLDARISSFSKFNGHTIPSKKLHGKGRIVFDSSTPPSFRRILNLGTRFFPVGVSCHILVRPCIRVCIMFTFHQKLEMGKAEPPAPLL